MEKSPEEPVGEVCYDPITRITMLSTKLPVVVPMNDPRTSSNWTDPFKVVTTVDTHGTNSTKAQVDSIGESFMQSVDLLLPGDTNMKTCDPLFRCARNWWSTQKSYTRHGTRTVVASH